MSFQWNLIAGYLYLELGIVVILMLPIASPRRWKKFFGSRLFTYFQQHAAFYFYVLLMVLGLLLIDAIREMRKYASATEAGHVHVPHEMKNTIKLFRAQRNFYITGFAIFLAFVIRRLVTMVLIQAEMLERSAEIIREAEKVKDDAKEAILRKELETTVILETNERIEMLKNNLTIAEQSRHAQVQMIKEMTDEIESWRLKYKELEKRMKEAGDN